MREDLAWWIGRIALLVLFTNAGCGGSAEYVCKRDQITGSEQCQRETNSPGEAAATAGAAAGAWAVVGCTVNGCPAPYRCNTKTKQCESAFCTRDADCGLGFACDVALSRCR